MHMKSLIKNLNEYVLNSNMLRNGKYLKNKNHDNEYGGKYLKYEKATMHDMVENT